jgi:ADP-ribosyl-[dinitrogen reductase] hydrolase
MALCLAESLVTCADFDAADQMRRYLDWYRHGLHSSTGDCFDIGNATEQALVRFEKTGIALAGSTDLSTAGNGSIMRLAPIALRYAGDAALEDMAAQSSRTTHGATEAVDACRCLATMIAAAVQGQPKEDVLTAGPPGLVETVAEIVAGSYKKKVPPEIRGSGHVVRSLDAALWAFHQSESFREGALLAVNLGDDADTTGAVYGQLAGAFYGADAIPQRWRDLASQRSLIVALADALLVQAEAKDHAVAIVVTPAVPFGRSYWVEPGRLLAGYYPGAQSTTEAERKLTALLDTGVRCFINLVEADEVNAAGQPMQPYDSLLERLAAARQVEVTHQRMPIVDLGVPAAGSMDAILDAIDRALARGRTVYVHCWGGYGRTGTVVGCWLARHGYAGEAALLRIEELRRNEETAAHPSPEVESQGEMVRGWARQ